MDKEIVKAIIEDGIYGISGDNSQPWRFEVGGEKLDILNIPDRDNPILNVRQRGSYVAHGSLIENMIISASSKGYKTDLKLFPDSSNSNLVARLSFAKDFVKNEPLHPYIKKRSTNRKPYSVVPLKEQEKAQLLAAADFVGGGELRFSEEPDDKKIIGKALAVTEQIALTTKELHQLFFKDMIWTEKEEREKKHGLFIKTLELPPPARLIFKLIKHWPVMRVFNLLGFYKLAALGNAKVYVSSGAHGAILVPDNDQDFVTAGRIMQRVWLTATKLGLFMQPVTGVLFLRQRMKFDPKPFNEKQVMMVKEAYGTLEKAFGAYPGVIAMLFRIGAAEPPSARSSRMEPEIIFKNGT